MKYNKISGLTLISAGITNLLARIGITIDLPITIILIISGYAAYETKNRHEFAIITSITAILYTILKAILFLIWLPEITGITETKLLILGGPFLLMTTLFSFIALYTQLKLSKKRYPRY
ncbi:MAG: hypothetical protein BTN85_1610 [Candidatus Methanohalarchaeum thermophilum]|uniref:Uncharacterized protein n=1 Tax=Methanohalarchaeum thermophilum TaxID=1903181 RepID=A0A1Q6DXK9_METT1|nr:MAG: hypothetical protein BTN85_1610 [Candidatus Methanohalarchaeum thermophilum]